MSVWENIPLIDRESIKKSLYRLNRIQSRKNKINSIFNEVRKEVK